MKPIFQVLLLMISWLLVTPVGAQTIEHAPITFEQAIDANNQGHALAAQNHFAQAEQLYRTALSGLQHTHNPRVAINRAAVLNNLGVALVQQQQSLSALSVFEEAVSLRAQHLGNHHALTLLSRHNLAITHLNLQQTQQACAHMQQVASAREQTLGSNHPDAKLSRRILNSIRHC